MAEVHTMGHRLNLDCGYNDHNDYNNEKDSENLKNHTEKNNNENASKTSKNLGRQTARAPARARLMYVAARLARA